MAKPPVRPPQLITFSAAILGQVLELARRRLNLKKREVADIVGVSATDYARIEAGQINLSIIQLRTVAMVLRTTPAKIIAALEAGEVDARTKGIKVITGFGKKRDLKRINIKFIDISITPIVPVSGLMLGGIISAAITL